ncbi:MAG: MFS transporter [Elusimicrobiota bacterium]|jgi:sugar phosphate permease|nr:MFS transporter [Elusimicrobiota bacterium]
MLSKLLAWFQPLPDAAVKITDQDEVKKQYRSWRIKLFISAYVGYAMYYLTRQNLSPIAHVFKTETGITNEQYGFMVSTSLIAYGIGKFLSGMLADKSNIRVFLASGLMGSSLINLFFGFLPSFPFFVFFWTLSQGFQSMGFPPIARIFAYWFTPKERASRWTLWASAHTIGITLAAVVAFIVLKTGVLSWHFVFVIPGIIGLTTSIWLLFNLTDKPSSVGLPSIEEYSGIEAPVKKQQSEESYWKILFKYVLVNKYIWILSFAFLCIYFVRYVTLSWAAIFLESRNLSKASIPLIFTLNPFVGAAGGIFAGWITDKYFKGRCTPANIIYFALLAASAYCFYIFAGPDKIFLTCFFIGAVGFFVDGPQNLVNVQISLLTTKEAVAAACGFCGLFGYIGGFAAGSGASWILNNWGWAGVFNSCIVASILGVLLVMCAWKKENADIRHHK